MHIEFGSDIDLESNNAFIKENVNNKWLENSYLFRSSRDAIKYIAKIQDNCRLAFVPYLCCESMIIPFEQYGKNVELYPLNSDYTINEEYFLNHIEKNSIILVSNYLGLKNDSKKENDFLEKLKNDYDAIIVRDCTQSLEEALFSDKSKDDYTIFSSRKWAGLPDGGILWSNKKIDITYDEVDFKYFDFKKKAMELKSKYLETQDANLKQEFMRYFKEAEEIIDNDKSIIEISSFSKDLLYKIDFEKILKIRKEHIKQFENEINNKVKVLSKGTNCSGQYAPIYVQNQKELQKYLAENSIYCPVIWPTTQNKIDKEFDFCNDIISHMLAVPCDQRYTKEEIYFIISKINQFNEKE